MSLLLEALKRAEEDARKRRVFADSIAAPLDGIDDDQSALAVQGGRVVPHGPASRPAALTSERRAAAAPAPGGDAAMPDVYFPELSLVPEDGSSEPAVAAMRAMDDFMAPRQSGSAESEAFAAPPVARTPSPGAPAPSATAAGVARSATGPASAASPLPAPTPRQAKAAVSAMMAPGAVNAPAKPARSRRTLLLVSLAALLMLPLVFLFVWGDALTGPAPVAMKNPPTPVVLAPTPPSQPAQAVAAVGQVADAAASAAAAVAASAAAALPVPVPVTDAVKAVAKAVTPTTHRSAATMGEKPPSAPRDASPNLVRRAGTAATPSARTTEAPAGAAKLTASPQVTRLDTLLASAYASFQAGKLEAAEAGYRDVVKADPTQRDAWLGLAVIAHAGNRKSEATDAYKQVLRLDPQNGTAITGLSNLDRSVHSPSEESRLRELLAAQPQSADLSHALGLILAAESRWAEAQPLFFKAHAVSPTEPQFAFNLAVALDRMHKPDVARQYYRTALQLAEGRRAGFDTAAARARLDALTAAATVKAP